MVGKVEGYKMKEVGSDLRKWRLKVRRIQRKYAKDWNTLCGLESQLSTRVAQPRTRS